MNDSAARAKKKRTFRMHRVLLASATVGIVTGLGVELLTITVEYIFRHLTIGKSYLLIAFLPVVGMSLAYFSLRFIGNKATGDTSDAYIQKFHDSTYQFKNSRALSRIIAAITTLSFGGALGLEAPSIFFGSFAGDRLQGVLNKFLGSVDRRILMVAGAAAGVSAVFKAPATGAVFALEVPYQDDFARDMLLPALVASAMSYIVFAAFKGTTPIFAVSGSAPFSLGDLGGALLLGIACGLGARVFAFCMRSAKRFSRSTPLWLRLLVGGGGLAGAVIIGHHISGTTLVMGPPYALFSWLVNAKHTTTVLFGMFALRALAPILTVGGGGVGGTFIPLVVCGAFMGRITGQLFHSINDSLFVVIGVAGFLGAGYRVPLAAVTFVAETTGRPGFIVPALLAAVAADVLMGESSVTTYQLPAN